MNNSVPFTMDELCIIQILFLSLFNDDISTAKRPKVEVDWLSYMLPFGRSRVQIWTRRSAVPAEVFSGFTQAVQ
jgi:hypothetical protein